jgi:hypothetical protein
MKLFTICSPIYAQTIEKQNCSMNLAGNYPKIGYLAGMKNKERWINITEFNKAHIDSFIRSNLDKLFNKHCYIITSVNGDIVTLDLALNIPSEELAFRFAESNGQICIWDIERKLEIYQLEEV